MATERKVAIVTGAASGLGRAMARGLVESGMDVVAVDRNAGALAAMAAARAGTPGSLLPLPADLIQPDAFDQIVAATLEKFGRIDVLINNAGVGQASARADQRRNPIRFWDATPEQWSRFLAVNATAPIMMSRAVVERRQHSARSRTRSATGRGSYLGTARINVPVISGRSCQKASGGSKRRPAAGGGRSPRGARPLGG
jgi:NAD(P)-dependent dehydrogenase (short-subunit alcohol dehydrogenase family)